jgi:hypothetical protein
MSGRSSFVVWLVLAVGPVIADAQVPSSLAADFRQALRWMPPDAEDLVATLKPFVISKSAAQDDWVSKPGAVLTFEAVVGINMSAFAASQSALASIQGREALWALAVKRGQEVQLEAGNIIKLGLHPYESVTIVKFREALPVELKDALRRVSSVRSLANGIEVFRAKNAAAAALLPQPDLLVLVSMVNSGNAMLDSLIDRIEHSGTSILFDDAGPAWSLTDLDATVWAIRRAKEGPGRPKDDVGRDWVVFRYDLATPSRALYRNVKAGSPWHGRIAEIRTDQDTDNVRRIMSGGGYADMIIECPAGRGIGCFMFSFMIEAMSLMIWI